MKNRKITYFLRTIGWWMLLCASAPIAADDAEIYSTKTGGDPRVMLLLDTSGSMYGAISTEDQNQRMATMKSVLGELLSKESKMLGDNFHVGLARYTSPGGAVLYPVKRLDEPAAVETEFYGADAADDFSVNAAFDATQKTLTMDVAQPNVAGLRIANINLPRGATIKSAVLVLAADENFSLSVSSSLQLKAKIAQTSNAPAVLNQTNYESIAWSAEEALSTPVSGGAEVKKDAAIAIDVTSLLETRLAASDWVAGNAALFAVSAVSGGARFYSYEGAYNAYLASGRFLNQFRPHLYVKYQVEKNKADAYGITETTVRDALLAVVAQMPTNADTPLIGAYFETVQYMLGKEVQFGLSRGRHALNQLSRVSALTTLDTAAVLSRDTLCNDAVLNSQACKTESITGTPRYQSPLTLEDCTSQAIVILTDGEPNSERCPSAADYASGDPYAVSENYCDLSIVADALATIDDTSVHCDDTDAWDCGIKLSTLIANPDKFGLADQPKIKTFTVGFGSDVTLGNAIDSPPAKLAALARAGRTDENDLTGGDYYSATNRDTLAEALKNIFENVADNIQVQASTGVAVDQTNRSQHVDQLYFSLFEPSGEMLWPGNLKRYRLKSPTTPTESFVIVDADDATAVDNKGFFVAESRSFWSQQSDGDTVTRGGARENIPAGNDGKPYPRNIFTDINSGNFDGNGTALLRIDTDLANDESTVAAAINTQLTVADNSERKLLLDWLNGSDTVAPVMGAPVHSRPLLLHYGYEETDGKSDVTKPVNTLYFSTNQGFLHGIDTGTEEAAKNADSHAGQELFAFAPKELLGNQKLFRAQKTGGLSYGLDASWVAYRHDENRDGAIQRADGDFFYLYGGMRMGGRNYYGLDVTDTQRKNNGEPKLQFVINPDTEKSGSKPFANLGQTWSVPVLTKLSNKGCIDPTASGCDRVVMIFGGGYDAAHEKTSDTMPTPVSNSQGASVYIVDAKSGELLWWASGKNSDADTKLEGMDFSITATLRTFDADYDGYPDHLYAVDLGGQVIRFDLAKNDLGRSVPDASRAKILAKLGGSASGAALKDYRRFYDAPAITQMRDVNNTRWVSIAVGSGYRSQPLSTETSEAFFMLRDNEPFVTGSDQTSSSVITVADLENASVNGVSGDPQGWYMLLDSVGPTDAGEKVVGEPFVLNQNLVFATYIPAMASSDQCKPEVGRMAMYQVALLTGAGLIDTNGDGSVDSNYLDYVAQGLTGGITLIQTPGVDGKGDNVVAIGSRLIDIDGGDSRTFVRTRWRSNEGEIIQDENEAP